MRDKTIAFHENQLFQNGPHVSAVTSHGATLRRQQLIQKDRDR